MQSNLSTLSPHRGRNPASVYRVRLYLDKSAAHSGNLCHRNQTPWWESSASVTWGERLWGILKSLYTPESKKETFPTAERVPGITRWELPREVWFHCDPEAGVSTQDFPSIGDFSNTPYLLLIPKFLKV